MKESISGSLEVDNDAVHLQQVEENLRPVDFSQVLDGVDHAMEGESVAVEDESVAAEGESVVAGDESVTHVEDRAYSNEDKEGRLTSLSRFISRIFFFVVGDEKLLNAQSKYFFFHSKTNRLTMHNVLIREVVVQV